MMANRAAAALVLAALIVAAGCNRKSTTTGSTEETDTCTAKKPTEKKPTMKVIANEAATYEVTLFGKKCKYKGGVREMADGTKVPDGKDCEVLFPNGDTYKGRYVDGRFTKGMLTLKATGEHFVGTFNKKGRPDKGSWYDKDWTLEEYEEGPEGDFNGDGRKETAYLAHTGYDEYKMRTFIHFSDYNIPIIKEQCEGGILQNLGDLNNDGRDELGLLLGCMSNCSAYHVWQLKNGAWRELIDEFGIWAPDFYDECEKNSSFQPVQKIDGKRVRIFCDTFVSPEECHVPKYKIVRIKP